MSTTKLLAAIMFGAVNVMGDHHNEYQEQEHETYKPSDECYNTMNKNPCTAANRARNKFYFPSCKDECNFIQCDEWGNAFERPCAPGTAWDPVAYTCNHDTHGKCDKYVPDKPMVPEYGKKCYDTHHNNPCTEHNIYAGHFYFPSCTSECNFIQCDANGNAFDMPCAGGTIWDQDKLTCNHDYDGKCAPKQPEWPTKKPEVPEYKPQVPEYKPETTKAKWPTEKPELDNKCYDTEYNNPCGDARAKGQYYYASCNSCCNFIQCDDFGKAFEMPCAPGTYWDPVAYACNHNNGQCKDKECRKKVTPSPTMWTTTKKPTEKPTMWTTTKKPTPAPTKKWTTTEKPTEKPTMWTTTKKPTQWTTTKAPTKAWTTTKQPTTTTKAPTKKVWTTKKPTYEPTPQPTKPMWKR